MSNWVLLFNGRWCGLWCGQMHVCFLCGWKCPTIILRCNNPLKLCRPDEHEFGFCYLYVNILLAEWKKKYITKNVLSDVWPKLSDDDIIIIRKTMQHRISRLFFLKKFVDRFFKNSRMIRKWFLTPTPPTTTSQTSSTPQSLFHFTITL